MKKIKHLLISLLLALLIFTPANVSAAYYDFEYDNYDVTIKVDEDGLYHITETVDVHFFEKKHGLYFEIPTKYEMVFDGKDYNYSFPVKDIKVTQGNLHDIENETYGKRVIIGYPDRYANEFERYQLSYAIKTHDLGLENGYQLFYYNLLGNSKGPINNFTFKVIFPKEIDSSKLKFYVGHDNSDEGISYTYQNKVLEGKYDRVIKPGESVTTFINLGTDYFVFPDYTDQIYIAIGSFALLTIALLIYHFIKGRDDLIVTSVELKAPDGLNSADCAYILNGGNSSKGTVSLIFELARKGHIKIFEENDEIYIENLDKLSNDLTEDEKCILNGLFKYNDDIKKIDEFGSQRFYNKYIKAKKIIDKKFTGDRALRQQENIKWLIIFTILNVVGAALTVGIINLITGYDYDQSVADAIFFAISIFLIFILVAIFNNKEKKVLKSIGVILMLFLHVILAGILIHNGALDIKFAFIIDVIYLINIVLIASSYKHSSYYIDTVGKVLGLKEFIKVTEEDRLRELVKDYPNLFFDILPYAYAFGLTSIWIKHFENLTIPQNENLALNDYYAYNTYNRIGRQMNRNFAKGAGIANSAKRGGGGGFSGGGGGGGFSGGGFGGSSSGSW